MILIEAVEHYGNELVQAIDDLKSYHTVIDDSQLSKILNSVAKEQNLILVGFIPSHKLEGKNSDDVSSRDFMLWLVLQKVSRSEDDFIETMKRCQLATKEVIKKMIQDKPNFTDTCGPMQHLEVPTIEANPVWGLNSCDGYEIEYQLRTNIFK